MKNRTTALYQYLIDANVLHGSDDAIARAKRDYRRLYKRQWKQLKGTGKEIRFTVTQQQFEAITAKAKAQNMKHTTFARHCVLTATGQRSNADGRLLEIVQLVGMAINALSKYTQQAMLATILLEQAETKLLEYIHH